eukprot:scaffold479_cov119-Isochrysis_galbana.AAC.8
MTCTTSLGPMFKAETSSGPSGLVSPSGRIPAMRLTSAALSSASSMAIRGALMEMRDTATGAHACTEWMW